MKRPIKKGLAILIPMLHPVCLLAAGPAATSYFQDITHFRNQSLALKLSQGQFQAAEDLRFSKRLFWTPTVSLSAGQQLEKINSEPSVTSTSGTATASLNLFRGFADWRKMEGADAAYKAFDKGRLADQLLVEIGASDLIFKRLYLKQGFLVQKEFLKMKEESLKLLKEKYTAGRAPLQEVKKFEVDLSQQRQKLRDSELELDENSIEIQTQFVETIQTEAWPFSENDKMGLLAKPNNLSSPILEKKYWLMRSEEMDWKAAKSAYWPELNFSVQYQVTPLDSQTTRQTLSMLSVSLPLWSRFETAAAVSSAYSGFLQSQTEYQTAEREESLRQTFLIKKLNFAREGLVDSKKNLERSKDLYRDYVRSFRAGRLSSNDLFLEQNRLLESESNLALSQLQFHQTLVEICALKGESVSSCLK